MINISEFVVFDVVTWDGGVNGAVDKNRKCWERKTYIIFISDKFASTFPPDSMSKNEGSLKGGNVKALLKNGCLAS